MLPTPDLSHLKTEDYKIIYEPAEDTFLLLDALEKDSEQLLALKPTICLEIGSGSGCVSSFLARIIGSSACCYLCTDINPYACICTTRTGLKNKIVLDAINASLSFPFHQRLRHAVDVILFNPPYVPTIDPEIIDAQNNRAISGAWAGGLDGMQVTNKFLSLASDLLSNDGRFYLVALKQNNIPQLRDRMSSEFKLKSDIVLQRRAGIEHLFVLRFERDSTD